MNTLTIAILVVCATMAYATSAAELPKAPAAVAGRAPAAEPEADLLEGAEARYHGGGGRYYGGGGGRYYGGGGGRYHGGGGRYHGGGGRYHGGGRHWKR